MRTHTTFGITFYLNKRKAALGQAPIYVRITVNSKSVDLSIKRKVKIEAWDMAKGQTKVNNEESIELNNYLGTVQTRLYECREELERERKFLTAKAVKSRYTGEDQQSVTLLQLVTYHSTEMKYELKEGTMKNYRSTEKYLKEFIKDKFKTTDIYLQELNYNFIKSFETYIRNNPLQPNFPCTQNGIMKHMERLCKLVTLAVKEEWLIRNPFIKYQLKFKKTVRGYLDMQELHNIEMVVLQPERLRIVRDTFVFACYTGLSYIETFNLSKENISRGIDGEKWIVGQRQKTGRSFALPILPTAQSILDKYSRYPSEGNKCFPVYSNQKTNQYLKELAELCAIKKHMTFHMARHTFATTITLANDIPIETVSEMLGHTKLSTTQIYAKVIKQKVSRDMGKLKGKLYQDQTYQVL